MRKIVITLIVLLSIGVLVILGAFIHAAFQPRPFDWNQNYFSHKRDPYGGYVIFSELNNFFPGNQVKRLGKHDLEPYYNAVNVAFYRHYEDTEIDSSLYLTKLNESQTINFNFFGLSSNFYLDDINTRALLLHLYQGNHALISSFSISNYLSEFTGIEFEAEDHQMPSHLKEKYTLILNEQDTVKVKPNDYFTKISSFPDSASVIAKNISGDVIGVKLKVGEGSLTFFTLPVVFSNYYILKEDRTINAALLKSLPNTNTYWANHFIGGYNFQKSKSLLSFIHAESPLAWAFYTLIFTVLVYFAFQIKREQRPVPVVAAPENVSLKFSEVISNLYLIRPNHKEIIIKKMIFFLEQVRSKYHLDTNNPDEQFFKRLSIKSGIKLSEVKLLFIKYERLVKQEVVDKEDLLSFNKLLQNFKPKKK